MENQYIQEFADKLKRCNIASVNYRYNEKTRVTKCKPVTIDDCLLITMDDLFQLCACWDYQACEGESLEYNILSEFIEYKLSRLGYPRDYESNSKMWSI